MVKIGYARVSTRDQNLDMQIKALKDAGCEKIFTEKISGRRSDKPQLKKVVKKLSSDDILIVWKIDRLGRNARDICELSEQLKNKNVTIMALKDGIDTSTTIGRFVMQILGSVAEIEVSHLSERTKEGLAAARRRGVKLGRPPGPSRSGVVEKIKYMKSRNISNKEIMQELNIPMASYYRYKKLI